MGANVVPWHYELCDALAEGDLGLARSICDGAMGKGEFHPDHPVDRALRLLAASLAGDLGPLAEAEASLARQADVPIHSGIADDARIAAYLIAGMLRSRTAPTQALAHFEAALRISPTFLPARVEAECLRRGLDRSALFDALGEPIPRADWRYMLAASELGLDAGVETIPTGGAICVRGLCTAQTPALLRLYRWLNPDVPIILATWADTAPELLEAIRGLAFIVVAPDPVDPGTQNKNRQMTLARAALTIAKGHVDHVLLVRSDLALFAPNILPSLYALNARFPVDNAHMRERLVIPDVFTREYRDFHVSDIMCFGAFDDVVRFWGAPFETDGDYRNTETYLGLHFTASVMNEEDPDSRRQYRRLLRDCFIVRDLDWFDGFWLRHPKMRNAAHLNFGDACVSQKTWEQRYFAPDPDKRSLFPELNVTTRELLTGGGKGLR